MTVKVDITDSHLWLLCPYELKEYAKALGGRWVADAKAWRYPKEIQQLREIEHTFPNLEKTKRTFYWEQQYQRDAETLSRLTAAPDASVSHSKSEFLRPYQRVGVKFISSRKNALLADEPGLGKTFQAIAAADLIGGDRNMIVCPNSLKANWVKELSLWSDEKHQTFVVTSGKSEREKIVENWKKAEGKRWLVCNYEALRLLDNLPSIDILIADEAHRVKNRKAKQSKALKALKRNTTILLTGTPIINRPDDLWHLLHLLDPKEFGSYWRFVNRYCLIKEKRFGDTRVQEIVGPKNIEELNRVLKPYMIRRLKSEVLKELPEKQYVVVPIQLEGRHLKVYKQMEEEALTILSNGEVVAAPVVIAQITRLRQIAASPRSLGDKLDGPKIDWVVDHLQDTGEKLVVFSQFRTVIDALEERLKKEKIRAVRITGAESAEERQKNVDTFQTEKGQIVCLCTIQAGGTGLTLTAASEVVFIDRAWTPADNEQAEDRLHRIGQRNNVTVYVLSAKDTIEEQVDTALLIKKKTASEILGDIQKNVLQNSVVSI